MLTRSYRNGIRSRSNLAAQTKPYPRVKVDFSITSDSFFGDVSDHVSLEQGDSRSKVTSLSPEEEISLAPACWLWDYLR